MNQLFTEIPLPERTKRLILVPQWTPLESSTCEDPYCKTIPTEAGMLEDECFPECPVCCRQLCPEHFKARKNIVWHGAREYVCCDDCSKLSPEERKDILELRVKLDQF